MLNNPKVQRLTGDQFKSWMNMLCAANDEGVLPNIRDLAFLLRQPEGEVSTLMDTLTELNFFNTNDDGDVVVNDWEEHQKKSDTSNERVKRYREKQRVSGGDGGVTLQETPEKRKSNGVDTDTDTDTDTEPPKPPKGDFDEWWKEYPNKIGKGAAKTAYSKAIKKASAGELLLGVRRYIEEKPPDRQWCNPATWLNQERWTDEPSNPKQSNGTTTQDLDRALYEAAIELEPGIGQATGGVHSGDSSAGFGRG